jgi:hypothetical protein
MAANSSRRFLFGVFNASMIHGRQAFYQTVAHAADFFERQAAFVELPIEEPLTADIFDQAFDSGGRWFDEHAAGAFHGVGDHQNAGLLGLGLWPWIAKRTLIDLAAVGVALIGNACLAIEILDQRRAVVLLN